MQVKLLTYFSLISSFLNYPSDESVSSEQAGKPKWFVYVWMILENIHLTCQSLRMCQTTCAQALKAWEEKNGKKAAEAVEVKLCANIPSIIKMDNSLGNLVNCEQLSLSTNSIDRIAGLNGNMAKLRILSLGRNGIKKIEKLDDIAGTLEQLWISYNDISSLDGLMNLTKLNTLYCARNNIKSFSELGKLVSACAFFCCRKYHALY